MAVPWAAIINNVMDLGKSALSGWLGARMGKKQMQMGEQMMSEAQAMSAANPRPEMMTPAAINAMMAMSKGRMYQNMPGMNIMNNQVNQATSGALAELERMGIGSESTGAVADIYAKQLQNLSGISAQNAMYRDTAQKGYLSDLNTLGQWQQQAWQWNAADPYLQAQAKAAQLETMGRQGQWEGLKNKMGSWAQAFGGMADTLSGSNDMAGLGDILGAIIGKGGGGGADLGSAASFS